MDGARVVGTGDAPSCTEAAVRMAVEAGGKVRFDCGDEPVVIKVTRPLQARGDVVIDGENKVTLSGGQTTRVLVGSSNKRLTLQRLTIRDGRSKDGGGAGGLHTGWRGNLTIVGCRFTGNVGEGDSERAGGAISTHESRVVIVDSVFENNTGRMGGALNILLSDAELINVTVVDNTTTEFGGAVYIDGAGIENLDPAKPSAGWKGVGSVHVCGSTISRNHGGKTAGGLYFCGYDANHALIERSVVSDNSSDGGGGGIVAQCNSRITIKQSLIAYNRGHHGGGVWASCSATVCPPDDAAAERRAVIQGSSLIGNESTEKDTIGGGLYASSPVSLEAVTIARNRGYYGAAIAGGSNVWAKDVLIVDNERLNPHGTSGGCGKGGLAKAEGVLEWPAVAATEFDSPCQADGITGDPQLGMLEDNGGPTATCALGADSAAVGRGTSCTGVDQRGKPRQEPCDVGAFQTTK